MSGTVEAIIGGVKRNLRVELKIAAPIEQETGRGIMAVGFDFASGNGRVSDAEIILRNAMLTNGSPYTSAQVYDMMERDGVGTSIGVALQIINALIEKPKDAPGKKSKPTRRRPSTSQPENS